MTDTDDTDNEGRFSEAEIVARVGKLAEADARGIVVSVVDLLYGIEGDREWNADTLDALAALLDDYGLAPECPASPE